MKKQIISIITAILILPAPYAHTMDETPALKKATKMPFSLRDLSQKLVVGLLTSPEVKNHYAQNTDAWFSKSPSRRALFSLGQISKPDRFYTENILSADERPDQEYIDELYKMKEVRKHDTRLAQWPVILKKADLSDETGQVGVVMADADNWPKAHSTIRIDQKVFDRARIAYNTEALAHELGHVIANHTIYAQTSIAEKKRIELEAEVEAYKTLAQCGYYKTIDTLRNDTILSFDDVLKHLDGLTQQSKKTAFPTTNYMPLGACYPSVLETYTYQTQALNECRKDVDPKNTQDSAHLMRNGCAL
jgi:hypothetical protein